MYFAAPANFYKKDSFKETTKIAHSITDLDGSVIVACSIYCSYYLLLDKVCGCL